MYQWPIWRIDSKIRYALGACMWLNFTEIKLMLQWKSSSVWVSIAGLLRPYLKKIGSLKSKGDYFEVTSFLAKSSIH